MGTWYEAFLSGFPHLLIGLLVALPEFLRVAGLPMLSSETFVGYFPAIVLALGVVSVAGYSLVKGWRRWTASWIFYIIFLPITLVNALISQWPGAPHIGSPVFSLVIVVVIPAGIAWILYAFSCQDRMRGLLASIPLMVIVWIYFHEFVPDLPRGLAWFWLCGLAFCAGVLILKIRRFSTAVWIALAVPVLGGLPNTAIGVYLGGTLPFSEPGPSMRVVLLQFIPFLSAVATLALGPQLAYRLRQLGRNGTGGQPCWFYRLAMGGLLVAILAVLCLNSMAWNIGSSFELAWNSRTGLQHGLGWILVGGVSLYAAGFFLLLRALLLSDQVSGEIAAAIRLLALFVALPGVPFALLAAAQISFGTGPLALPPGLQQVVEVAWLLLAAWSAGQEFA